MTGYADWLEAVELTYLGLAAEGVDLNEPPLNTCEHASTGDLLTRCARHRQTLRCDLCTVDHRGWCPPGSCGKCGRLTNGDYFVIREAVPWSFADAWTGSFVDRVVPLCDGLYCGALQEYLLKEREDTMRELIDTLAANPPTVLASANQFTESPFICAQHPDAVHLTMDALTAACGDAHMTVQSCDMCGTQGTLGGHTRLGQLLARHEYPMRALFEGEPAKPVDLVGTILLPNFGNLCEHCAWHWTDRERVYTGLYAPTEIDAA